MKYLNKKFIRDIMQQWKQFVSVLIMALISVSIYCGMSSVWTGMDESYTDYKEKTNLADAYIDGVNISDEDISNIKKLPYVNQAEGSMFVKFNTKIDNEDSELYGHVKAIAEGNEEQQIKNIKIGEIKNSGSNYYVILQITEGKANSSDTSTETKILSIINKEKVLKVTAATDAE